MIASADTILYLMQENYINTSYDITISNNGIDYNEYLKFVEKYSYNFMECGYFPIIGWGFSLRNQKREP